MKSSRRRAMRRATWGMLVDDILEDETIEDVSEDDLEALPFAVMLDDRLQAELGNELSRRQPPAPPTV